jgi:hypothetical protein
MVLQCSASSSLTFRNTSYKFSGKKRNLTREHKSSVSVTLIVQLLLFPLILFKIKILTTESEFILTYFWPTRMGSSGSLKFIWKWSELLSQCLTSYKMQPLFVK